MLCILHFCIFEQHWHWFDHCRGSFHYFSNILVKTNLVAFRDYWNTLQNNSNILQSWTGTENFHIYFCVQSLLYKISTLHNKWSFPLRIFSVNVTQSAVSANLVALNEELHSGKLHFLCSVKLRFTCDKSNLCSTFWSSKILWPG